MVPRFWIWIDPTSRAAWRERVEGGRQVGRGDLAPGRAAAEAEACAMPADPAQLGHPSERHDVPWQGPADMRRIEIGSAGKKRGGTARQKRHGFLQATGLGK